ncbi:MAG: hypothetical protein WBX16_22720 [Candidatus Acidiferrales bacterium]
MGYLHDTPGHRLLRFLMNRGGHATLSEIARLANDGRLYTRAKPELDGLIIEQKCGSPRTRRSVTRVFLTMKGWAACAMLRPAWQPRRLTTDMLRAWVRELQDERDPWALQFVKDARDAAELKRLRSIGHIRPPLKRRGPPKGIQPKGGFQRQIDPLPVGAKVIPPAFGKIPPRPFTPSTPQPTEPRTPQEKYLAALRQPPSPPSLEQMEARRLEAERRQRDCPICQTGVDPNFLMHDPASHLAYL